MPNRDLAQIGLLFKQALPEKLKHLISTIDLDNWEEKIDTIEREVATPKIIVDQVTNEIDRVKVATSDKAFVEQVKSLEKIVWDLT